MTVQPHKPHVPTDPLLQQMPLGKYHPSNYKNKVKIPEKLVVTQPASTTNQPKHHRKNSEVKKKLQQYQRDMVEQATIAGRMQISGTRPISPRLLPLDSPGPVTPMELEEKERQGYLSGGMGSSAQEKSLKERRVSS